MIEYSLEICDAESMDCCFQEYSRCVAKVEKYREKERTGTNVVKLDTVSSYVVINHCRVLGDKYVFCFRFVP